MRICLRSLALIVLLTVPCASADDETPSALAADANGWSDLLAQAGPKLEGWTRSPLPPGGKINPSSQWSLDVATNTLVCQGDGGHEWLRWNKELADCIYHVEWRFTVVPGKKGYNSGIYARNSRDATIWHQAQTGDGSGGYLFGNTLAGGTTKRLNLSKQQASSRVKPAGEWNVFEITCRGKEMTLWVNGAVTNRWGECDVPTGYVGLEAEGYRIEFRNVKVKTLDQTGRATTETNPGASAKGGELKVGAAVRVITPNPLLPVSGGMGAPNPTREKRGDITARAVVFQSGDVSVAVVALDLIGFPSVLGDRVRAGQPHSGRPYPDRLDSHAQRS